MNPPVKERQMKHGSLFSGIGGFDLAAEWMGWENVFHCEWNPFGQKVLKHYWPNAITYHDITKSDFTVHRGTIDILTGGFPCQPYSSAGKRKGTEDSRHLWPEMLRAIREIQPRYVVGENVRGLTNWNGGLVFDQVQADLENEGFEVLPFLLPACAVNAPHRRDRIWFVAHATNCNDRGVEREFYSANGRSNRQVLPSFSGSSNGHGKTKPTTHTGSEQLQRRMHKTRPEKAKRYTGTRNSFLNERGDWQNFPTQSPIRTRNDGFSRPLLRYITKELYGTISKENRIENLPEMWKSISSQEVWEKIRRFYSLESKEILFQTMQLYEAGSKTQIDLSPFSEKVSGPILRKLRRYGSFGSTPQGQKLEKQRSGKLGYIVSFLPHEIPLAAGAFETQLLKFETWYRKESIAAYGNAIVPQVAYQIFKAIEQTEMNPPVKGTK